MGENVKHSRVLDQCWRGCGTLPHVGSHPGTGVLVGLVCITGAAGAQAGGLVGFTAASIIGVCIYGPMYLYGAYSRAQLSDKLEARP